MNSRYDNYNPENLDTLIERFKNREIISVWIYYNTIVKNYMLKYVLLENSDDDC